MIFSSWSRGLSIGRFKCNHICMQLQDCGYNRTAKSYNIIPPLYNSCLFWNVGVFEACDHCSLYVDFIGLDRRCLLFLEQIGFDHRVSSHQWCHQSSHLQPNCFGLYNYCFSQHWLVYQKTQLRFEHHFYK